MALSNDDVAAGVRRYLDLVAHGTADDITALYAEDASIEDPVGGKPLRGREEIRAFYATIEKMSKATELLTLRTCAGQAAFHFEIVTDLGSSSARMSPLEVMTFAEDGAITGMRAFWSDADLVME